MNSEAAAMLRQSAEGGEAARPRALRVGIEKEQPIGFGYASPLGLFHSIREGKVSGNAYTIGLELGIGLKASPH